MDTLGIIIFLLSSLGVAITFGVLLLGLLMRNLREILLQTVLALITMCTICIGDLWVCGALPYENRGGYTHDEIYLAEKDDVQNDTQYALNKEDSNTVRIENTVSYTVSNQVSSYDGKEDSEIVFYSANDNVPERISDYIVEADITQNKLQELQVHFIDVGEGDCTLITCSGQSMLIDAGDDSKGTAVQLYLQNRGIDSLDYVIGTHPDEDHIGGMDVVVTKFDCKQIMLPNVSNDTAAYDALVGSINYKGYQITLPIVGSIYSLGDAVFTIVAPNGNYNNTNNYSIGIRLLHGENSFLFIGDAEEEAEQDMLFNGMELSADVLKVAHHGSRSSSSWEFINAVNPTYAVISCGINNAYGHPSAETLNTLRSAGITVYRTDEKGSIVATSDGYGIFFNSPLSESWQAGEVQNVVQNVEQSYVNQEATRGEIQGVYEVEGIDSTLFVEPEMSVTYVLNTNTGKFHRVNCRDVKKIAKEHRIDSDKTKDEIIALGYQACKHCKP